jgi:hypothetical protein
LLSKTDWCSYFIHLRSLNFHNFQMVEAMGLKLSRRGLRQWHHMSTEFHENLSVGSKDFTGHTDPKTDRRTDRRTADPISVLSLWEHRLKMRWVCVCVDKNSAVWRVSSGEPLVTRFHQRGISQPVEQISEPQQMLCSKDLLLVS